MPTAQQMMIQTTFPMTISSYERNSGSSSYSMSLVYHTYVTDLLRFFRLFFVFVVPSSFRNRIGSIIFCSSKKQVVRVNTWRIVAFMAYQFSFWNSSIFKYPRNTMRFLELIFNAYGSITFFRFGPKPYPAIFRFFDVIEETFGKILLHGKLILSRAIPRTFNDVARFFHCIKFFAGVRTARTPLATAAPAFIYG